MFLRRSSSTPDADWISISDLMAGLMMFFLFVAISYLISVQAERKTIFEMKVQYEQMQDASIHYQKLLQALVLSS